MNAAHKENAPEKALVSAGKKAPDKRPRKDPVTHRVLTMVQVQEEYTSVTNNWRKFIGGRCGRDQCNRLFNPLQTVRFSTSTFTLNFSMGLLSHNDYFKW